MQQQNAVSPVFIYSLIIVCMVSVIYGYRQTTQTRPQRMKEWVALRLQPEPKPQPAFYKLLEEYQRNGRQARGPAVKRRPSTRSLLASAPLRGNSATMAGRVETQPRWQSRQSGPDR